MLDCRYYDLCYLTDDSCNGEPECPKRDHCQFYSPMPNVNALLALADDIDKQTDGSMFDAWLEDGHYIARRIREALGVTADADA